MSGKEGLEGLKSISRNALINVGLVVDGEGRGMFEAITKEVDGELFLVDDNSSVSLKGAEIKWFEITKR